MRQIIQCIPNFSEGRRAEVIDAIVDAIRASGVTVLQVHANPDQNRSIVTFVGEIGTVERAALAAAAVAAERIDLAAHAGTHPRIGATDVLPFIPASGATIDDCIALARRVGQRLAAELNLPVYLYGEAATRPERATLAAIRAGEYEELREAIATDPEREPDFGPKELGPAGATAVGARHPTVHLEITLDSDQPEVIDQICSAIAESGGGLKNVVALPTSAGEEGPPRMSIHISRPQETPIPRVIELVRAEALRCGARVRTASIVGFVPQSSLVDAAAWYLQLDGLRPEQILENNLTPDSDADALGSATPEAFVHAVAADTPTPGGGAVAALAGALAAALDTMVTGLTIGRPKYADVADEMHSARRQAAELQAEMLRLMAADSAAFEQVMAAYRLPRDAADTAEARREAIQSALRQATEVPLEIMERSVEILRLARTCAELGNAKAVSDAGVAGYMACAATQSASLNVDINILGLRNLEEGDGYRRRSAELLREAKALADEVDRLVRGRIAG